MPDPGFAFLMAAVVAGAFGGSLVGVAGGMGGDLARRGERRRWLGAVLGTVVAIGGVTAILDMVAGGLNQPPGVWPWLDVIGVGLIVLAWRINRGLRALRAAAPRSKIIVPGDPDRSR